MTKIFNKTLKKSQHQCGLAGAIPTKFAALLLLIQTCLLWGNSWQTVAKELFDSKQPSSFNQTPKVIFSSKTFREVILLGDKIEGDIAVFNPKTVTRQHLDIDSTKEASWAFAENVGDELNFLMYFEEAGSRNVVIYKKSSMIEGYKLYCTYTLPPGKSVKLVAMNDNLSNLVIVSTGGIGANTYYYDFDKNSSPSNVQAPLASSIISGLEGSPTDIVFHSNTIFMSRNAENVLSRYTFNGSSLSLEYSSSSAPSMTKLDVNPGRTIAIGYKPGSNTQIKVFYVDSSSMFEINSILVTCTLIQAKLDESNQIIAFCQEKIQIIKGILVSGETTLISIVTSLDYSPDTSLIYGHYVYGKEVVMALTNSYKLLIFKKCDPSIPLQCENHISKTYLGCDDKLKYPIPTTGNCHNCDFACDGCYDYGINFCYNCTAGLILQGGVCVPMPACHATCLTCNGTLENECLSCTAPRELSSDKKCCDVGNGYKLHPTTSKCIIDPVIQCANGCTKCLRHVDNGACLDEVLPKLEKNIYLSNRCFNYSDFEANKNLCLGQDMVRMVTLLEKQTFLGYSFLTVFISKSKEYLDSLHKFLAAHHKPEELKEYFQVVFNPKSNFKNLESWNPVYLSDQKMLKTTMKFNKSCSNVDISIKPRHFNLKMSLPKTQLIDSTLMSPGHHNRILQIGNLPDDNLSITVNATGNVSNLEELLKFRFTRFTEALNFLYIDKSGKDDFPDSGFWQKNIFALSLFVKIIFWIVLAKSFKAHVKGINTKSYVHFIWILCSLLASTTFMLGGDSLNPFLKKLMESLTMGWFSDIFSLSTLWSGSSNRNLSADLKTEYTSMLKYFYVRFLLSVIFKLFIQVNLFVGKFISMRLDDGFETCKPQDLKRRKKLTRFYYYMFKHIRILDLTISMHILTSSLVEFKLCFNSGNISGSEEKLPFVLVILEILLSSIYVALHYMEYMNVLPLLDSLYSDSLFIRVQGYLGILSSRRRFQIRTKEFIEKYYMKGLPTEENSLRRDSDSREEHSLCRDSDGPEREEHSLRRGSDGPEREESFGEEDNLLEENCLRNKLSKNRRKKSKSGDKSHKSSWRRVKVTKKFKKNKVKKKKSQKAKLILERRNSPRSKRVKVQRFKNMDKKQQEKLDMQISTKLKIDKQYKKSQEDLKKKKPTIKIEKVKISQNSVSDSPNLFVKVPKNAFSTDSALVKAKIFKEGSDTLEFFTPKQDKLKRRFDITKEKEMLEPPGSFDPKQTKKKRAMARLTLTDGEIRKSHQALKKLDSLKGIMDGGLKEVSSLESGDSSEKKMMSKMSLGDSEFGTPLQIKSEKRKKRLFSNKQRVSLSPTPEAESEGLEETLDEKDQQFSEKRVSMFKKKSNPAEYNKLEILEELDKSLMQRGKREHALIDAGQRVLELSNKATLSDSSSQNQIPKSLNSSSKKSSGIQLIRICSDQTSESDSLQQFVDSKLSSDFGISRSLTKNSSSSNFTEKSSGIPTRENKMGKFNQSTKNSTSETRREEWNRQISDPSSGIPEEDEIFESESSGLGVKRSDTKQSEESNASSGIGGQPEMDTTSKPVDKEGLVYRLNQSLKNNPHPILIQNFSRHQLKYQAQSNPNYKKSKEKSQEKALEKIEEVIPPPPQIKKKNRRVKSLLTEKNQDPENEQINSPSEETEGVKKSSKSSVKNIRKKDNKKISKRKGIKKLPKNFNTCNISITESEQELQFSGRSDNQPDDGDFIRSKIEPTRKTRRKRPLKKSKFKFEKKSFIKIKSPAKDNYQPKDFPNAPELQGTGNEGSTRRRLLSPEFRENSLERAINSQQSQVKIKDPAHRLEMTSDYSCSSSDQPSSEERESDSESASNHSFGGEDYEQDSHEQTDQFQFDQLNSQQSNVSFDLESQTFGVNAPNIQTQREGSLGDDQDLSARIGLEDRNIASESLGRSNRRRRREARSLRSEQNQLDAVEFIKCSPKKKFVLNQNPALYYHEQEDPRVNQIIDDYFFFLLGSLKTQHLNRTEIPKKYQQPGRKWIKHIAKYPSLMLFPLMKMIILVQIACPSNSFLLNILVAISLIWLATRNIMRMNLIVGRKFWAILITLLFSALINIFQVIYYKNEFKYLLGGDIFQPTFTIFMTFELILFLILIDFMLADASASHNKYEEDVGKGDIFRNYEKFRDKELVRLNLEDRLIEKQPRRIQRFMRQNKQVSCQKYWTLSRQNKIQNKICLSKENFEMIRKVLVFGFKNCV